MAKQIFKVQMDGVELTKAQAAGLQKTINAAATSYIAKNMRLIPKDSIWGMKNPEWLGIWLKDSLTFLHLKQVVLSNFKCNPDGKESKQNLSQFFGTGWFKFIRCGKPKRYHRLFWCAD